MAVKPDSKGNVKGTNNNDTITWISSKDWQRALTVNAGAGQDLIDFRKSKYKNTLNGEAGDDTIYGGTKDDKIIGGAGDDVLYGYNGNDTIIGGDGRDSLFGGNGIDSLVGGNGDDTIEGGAGFGRLFGLKGNDYILGGKDKDTIDGGDGNDQIVGHSGDDIMFGDDGDDFMDGGNGNDVMYGGNGNDLMRGGSNNDYIDGGDGDDNIQGQFGNNTLIGGYGNDTIYGGKGDDSIEGWDGNDNIQAREGNDTINPGAGNNTINGGLGDDSIYAYFGSNQILYYKNSGNDVIFNPSQPDDKIYLKGFTENINDSIEFRKTNDDLIIYFDKYERSNSITLTNYMYQSLDETIHELYYADIPGEQKLILPYNYSDLYNLKFLIKSSGAVYGSDNTEEIMLVDSDYNSIYASKGDDTINLNNTNYNVCSYNVSSQFNSSFIGINQTDTIEVGNIANIYYGEELCIDTDKVNQYINIPNYMDDDKILDVKIRLNGGYEAKLRTFITDTGVSIVKGNTHLSDTDTMVIGSNGAVTITGSNTGSGSKIRTGNKDDVINLSNGTNTVFTYNGNDTINLTGGTNTIHTGNGNDVINMTGGNSTIYADYGNDTINGSSSNDVIYSSFYSDISSTKYGDKKNTLIGNGGNDTLCAFAEDAKMYGGEGHDTYKAYLTNNIYIDDDYGSNILMLQTPDDKSAGNAYIALNVDRFAKSDVECCYYVLNYDSYNYWLENGSFADANGQYGGIEVRQADFNVGHQTLNQIHNESGKVVWDTDIQNLAQEVSGWLTNHSTYDDVKDVLTNGSNADITAVQAIFNTFNNTKWKTPMG